MDIDQNAMLTSLMEAYFSNIWTFVYTYTCNYHTADDLTQEVFVRALIHLDDFRNESSHKTWLFTIARNVCRDNAKSAFTRRVVPFDNPWFEASFTAPQGVSYEDDIMRTILSDELWREILKLSRLQREVVLLHLREELTFREIAGIIHAKEVTVRARYRRALEHLRELLSGGDYSDV